MVYLVAVVVGIEAGDQSEMCFGSQSSNAFFGTERKEHIAQNPRPTLPAIGPWKHFTPT